MTVRIATERGVDVTEGVQAAYDLVLNSMDWGSGFLSVEDIEPLIRLAIAADYDLEPIIEYVVGSRVEAYPGPYPRYGSPEYEEYVKRHKAWSEEQRTTLRKRALAQIDAIRREMTS